MLSKTTMKLSLWMFSNFLIAIIIVFIGIAGYSVYASSSVVWLSVINTFSWDVKFVSGSVYQNSWVFYTNNTGVQVVVSATTWSRYEFTGDLSNSFTWVWTWAYQEIVFIGILWGLDGFKSFNSVFYREYWSGNEEVFISDDLSVFFDQTAPSIVDLISPSSNSRIDGVYNFNWSSAIDTGVWFEKYSFVIARDPFMNDIVYVDTLSLTSLLVNLSFFQDGSYYWLVSSDDYLWNSQVSNISSFVIWAVSSSITTPVTVLRPGWWTRWHTLYDVCPDGDYTNSYYDNDCWKKEEDKNDNKEDSKEESNWFSEFDKNYISNYEKFKRYHNEMSNIDWEIYTAYEYAYHYNITTMSFEDADLYGVLLRKHFAKMIVNYASGAMNLWPTVNTGCVFDDVEEQSEELKNYMKLSCEFWLMWLKYDGVPSNLFWPDLPVSRAMFGAVLSRLIFGEEYNWNEDNWYEDHLDVLKNADIMRFINYPHKSELRWFAMIMFKRADENWYLKVRYWDLNSMFFSGVNKQDSI